MTGILNNLATIVDDLRKVQHQADIWEDSPYGPIKDLYPNNVGLVGERLLQHCLILTNIPGQIHGVPGGIGDGNIRGETVEVKTARQGNSGPVFQHELGCTPWLAKYMCFIDISPVGFYLTIFSNNSEPQYKVDRPIFSLFPSKKITHRSGGNGDFKFDTTVSLNNQNHTAGRALFVTGQTTAEQVRAYIDSVVPE